MFIKPRKHRSLPRLIRLGVLALAVPSAVLGQVGPPDSRRSARLSDASPRVQAPERVRSLVSPQSTMAPPLEGWQEGKARQTQLSATQEIAFANSPQSEEFSQLRQSSAPLSGGGFGVVWVEGSFPSRNVRMQWLHPDGSFVFAPGGKIVAGLAADEADAVIVPHPTAGAYVAFQRSNAGSSGQVLVQYFDASGAPQWPGDGVAASDVLSESQVSPNLVANPGGGVFGCFESFNFLGAHDLRCQLINAAGVRQWTSIGKSVGATGWLVLPRLVSDGAGGLLVFWRNQREPLSDPVDPMLMQGQRFASDGSRLWGAGAKVIRTTNLAESSSHSYRFFQAVSDGNGGAVLAFNDWTGSSQDGLDVMAQRVSADGSLLWGSGLVVTGVDGQQQHDVTIAAGDGGAFVGVVEFPSDVQSRLLLYRLGPDGTHLWSANGTLVSDPQAIALDYGLEGSCDGGILRLAWTHQISPATFEFDVKLAGYTLARQRWGGAAGISLTSAPSGQFSRELVHSPDGKVLAIWDDMRSGTFSNLDAYGATLADAVWTPRGDFFSLVPCRLLDTRNPAGSFGGPSLASGQPRLISVHEQCGIPASAKAVAVNVSAVFPTSAGFITFYPGDETAPLASTINFSAGQIRANNAVLAVSGDGVLGIQAFVADAGHVHLIIDVAGYFD